MNLFEKNNPGEIYAALRGQVLGLRPTPQIPETMSGQKVIAAVVDQNVGIGTATLVCVADGSTSLYYSNGGGELGLGHAHPGVRDAARAFLSGAGRYCTLMEHAADCPIPPGGWTAIHLITSEGVFRQRYQMERIGDYQEDLQALAAEYERVLAAIREAKGDSPE